MKIAVACDHGAYDLKQTVVAHLTKKGYEVVDFGCHSKDSCDYPDFAGPAAKAVAKGSCDRGVLLCTTGIGVSIAANKVKGIRCAGVTGENLALAIVDKWLETPFSGEARHQRRIDKVMALENE